MLPVVMELTWVMLLVVVVVARVTLVVLLLVEEMPFLVVLEEEGQGLEELGLEVQRQEVEETVVQVVPQLLGLQVPSHLEVVVPPMGEHSGAALEETGK